MVGLMLEVCWSGAVGYFSEIYSPKLPETEKARLEMQKQRQPLPGATVGFLLCFALFLLHLISHKYSLQLPPPPSKDLFMETESLNPCSLYSSEAAR